jgi:hypothetical protein
MAALELHPIALPPRGQPSAPALLVATLMHLVLLWALFQSPPVERATRQVIYQILQPIARPVVLPPPPQVRPVAPPQALRIEPVRPPAPEIVPPLQAITEPVPPPREAGQTADAQAP